MKRRRFIKSVALGSVGIAVGCSGEGNPAGSSTIDPPVPEVTTSSIALVKTNNRAEGVSRLMELLDFESPSGKDVILKPNFNTSDPPPASTHNDTLEQIIIELRNRNASSIELCERSYQNFTDVISTKGIEEITGQYGINITNLDVSDCTTFSVNTPSWPNGFQIPIKILSAQYLVMTCCLKTHFIGRITLSLKNAVGLLPASQMQILHQSERINSMIAEINNAFVPKLIIIDGVDAFIEGGPSQGTRVNGNVMIAGTDRVALDVVGTAILKELGSQSLSGSILQLEQIARARQLNLGNSSLEQIEFLTDDENSLQYTQTIGSIIEAG